MGAFLPQNTSALTDELPNKMKIDNKRRINGKINLRIEDLSGKLVSDENYFISSQDKRILNKDISALVNGMYLIHVMHDGLTYQSKFQKK